MLKSIFSMTRKELLADLLYRCNAIKPIDVDRIQMMADASVKAGEPRLGVADLEQRWYASLPDPDYGVYDADEYIAELWVCWIIYSRKYLLEIQRGTSLPPCGVARSRDPVRCVVDLGCGFGHTTAALKEIYPDAAVIGTNLKGTLQYEVARGIGKLRGFTVISDISEVGHSVDLVFASEYFEHIYEPVAHLFGVVRAIQPHAMLIANAFGKVSTGHFEAYKIGQVELSGKATSRIFNGVLKQIGYRKIKTKLWNNRPALWVR